MPTLNEQPNTTKKQPDERDGGSIHIATISGIPIRLHFTFLILLGFVFVSSSGGLGQVGRILSLFACVVLHELGHSVVAQRYGIRVSSITLYPIGGVARIIDRPKPKHEFWIALAGPTVNVVIACTLLGFGATFEGMRNEKMGFPQFLFDVNVMLVLFNVIPAFPMDGGRVLRAALAMSGRPYASATRLAAGIGQFVAVLFCIAGVFGHQWMLLFIAFFIYLGAGQESAVVTQEAMFTGLPVSKVMETDIHTLTPGETLKGAADTLLATAQHDFPIVLGSDVLGLLTRDRLLHSLASQGADAFVASVMDREYAQIDVSSDIGQMMSEDPTSLSKLPLLVFDGGKLAGMVTDENLTEYFAIQKVLKMRG